MHRSSYKFSLLYFLIFYFQVNQTWELNQQETFMILLNMQEISKESDGNEISREKYFLINFHQTVDALQTLPFCEADVSWDSD